MPDGHPYTVETMLGINDLRFAFPELEEVSFVKIDADTWTSCTWNGKRIKVWCFSRGDCSHRMTWEANIDIWIYLDATDFHMTGDTKSRVGKRHDFNCSARKGVNATSSQLWLSFYSKHDRWWWCHYIPMPCNLESNIMDLKIFMDDL